ncbi:hypothetical protein [Sphingomonas sp. VNH70]|uniref:hypothetical protein n=1 Tax=Sphingomonas silueang TaxID=3156617 RepID=UPI0032B5BF31
MKDRVGFVADMSRHLGDEIDRIIQRQAGLIRVVGGTSADMSAIVMMLATRLAAQGIGTGLLQAMPDKRDVLFEQLLGHLLEDLRAKRSRIMESVIATQEAARS